MQGPGLIAIVILLMVALNALMVVATIGVKMLRAFERRRVENLRENLEPALYDYLATGEVSQDLKQVKGRGRKVLSDMIVELLIALRGPQSQQMKDLAGELGLVRRDLGRLHARGRWGRAKAAENLGYYGGPETARPVSHLLKEDDETLQAVAARALSRIGTHEAAEFLADCLSSDSEITRLRIAENLERIGPLAVKQLMELVESEEEDERKSQVLAARVLGNLRVAEAGPTLCQAIQRHWNTDLRAQATLALGRISNPDDVPTIVEATEDNSWPVRAQAANALGMIGDVSTVSALEILTTDQEWWVRLNACRALVNIGPEGEKALVRTLENPDRFARDRAASTLEEQGVIRRLVGELAENNGRSEQAEKVIRSLVRAGTTQHLNRLSRSLPKQEERRALRRVLAKMSTEKNDA